MIKFAEYFMVNVLELFLTRMQRELQYYNLLTCFLVFLMLLAKSYRFT